MKKIQVYRALRLNRVDFVDKGANPGALITLAKRATTEERHMAEPQMDAEVAKRLAEAETKRVELEKRLADAEAKAVKAEADAQTNAEAVAKMLEDAAKTEAVNVAKSLSKIPGETDAVAHLIFTAKRKFDAADYESFVTVLKAANAQLAAGKLFAVAGKDSDGSNASDLDQMVQKRMTDHKEPQHVALSKVLETPEGKAAYSAIRGN